VKQLLKQCAPLLAIFFIAACSAQTNPTAPPEPTVAPSATAPAFRTEIPVVNTRTDRVAPTLAPTQSTAEIPAETIAAPTETLAVATTAPTETLPPTTAPTNAPANVIATTAPTILSSTTNLAPAVYVTDLKITPPQPQNKPAEFFFTVSFLNTVGETVNYPRWRVLIFPKGQTNTIGDPEGLSKTIAADASTQNTKPWSIKVGTACETFVAQPIWQDENGSRHELVQPDGKPLTLEFEICP
jgi:hypothetical protein